MRALIAVSLLLTALLPAAASAAAPPRCDVASDGWSAEIGCNGRELVGLEWCPGHVCGSPVSVSCSVTVPGEVTCLPDATTSAAIPGETCWVDVSLPSPEIECWGLRSLYAEPNLCPSPIRCASVPLVQCYVSTSVAANRCAILP